MRAQSWLIMHSLTDLLSGFACPGDRVEIHSAKKRWLSNASFARSKQALRKSESQLLCPSKQNIKTTGVWYSHQLWPVRVTKRTRYGNCLAKSGSVGSIICARFG
ncbi:hypothetical protein BJ741DRAFT_614350 [Chytriomyces cf. hyalinus JEL632]|nr:hypothetical protein BJ741DRAFT_614350 [Chytriomyces cf. hyalinus JEL632]